MTYRYPVGKLGCLSSFFFVIYSFIPGIWSFVFVFPSLEVCLALGLGLGGWVMVFRDKAIRSGWVDSFGSFDGFLVL